MGCVLVTGGAGFIGFHTCKLLAENGYQVVAVDDMNSYYSPTLKRARANELKKLGIKFYQQDISQPTILGGIMATNNPRYVIHLAAQPGVRYSAINPMAYTQANLVGMTSVQEACRFYKPEHLLFASSSSVYGPMDGAAREDNHIPDPKSYYALTKRTNELSNSLFSAQTGIPTTGLRFFTVYGELGRPDMAYWSFSEQILEKQQVTLYGENTTRDFTYVGDVAKSIQGLMTCIPEVHRIVNIGNEQPVSVKRVVELLSELYETSVTTTTIELPKTDPIQTWCDSSLLRSLIEYSPNTQIEDGMKSFASWFKQNHTTYKK